MDFLTLENFLWAQAGLVIIGVIYIFRKSNQPGARLRWKQKTGPRALPEEMKRPSEIWRGSTTPRARSPDSPEGRSLNIHFMHNGHSWDAYEALGLPAGANIDRAVIAHRDALARNDDTAREFYDRALEAIRLHLTR